MLFTQLSLCRHISVRTSHPIYIININIIIIIINIHLNKWCI